MYFAIGYRSGNAKLTHCRMMKQIFSFHLTTYHPLLYRKYNIYKLNRYTVPNPLLIKSLTRPITHPFQINLSNHLKCIHHAYKKKILEKDHDPFNAKPLLPSILIIRNRR